MNNILMEFYETNLMEEYKQAYDIIMVEVVGSRNWGIIDENSDYDINIISLDKKKSNKHDYYVGHSMEHINGSHVHWYIEDVGEMLSVDSHIPVWWALSNYKRSESDYILTNEIWRPTLNILQENSRLLLDYVINSLTKKNSFLLELKERNKITPEIFSKDIYRYSLVWYTIAGVELTEDIKYKLGKLKRMRWLEEEYINGVEFQGLLEEALQNIQLLINYYSQFSEDHFTLETNQFLLDYNEICNSAKSML